MKAIVTAIEDPWRDRIANVWGELKAVFGLAGLTGAVRPYLTFHVAEEYRPGIEDTLARIAARGTPFRMETHGIGIMQGALTEGLQSVVYLHVTRTEALDDVHHVIHHAAQPLAVNAKAAYENETWLPHIAVASGALPAEAVPQIVEFLGRREYNWSIEATNLCLIPDTRLAAAHWVLFELRGR
ncbi:MAG: 2'-5' RNA ligase family protein [Chloroflexi bacterium]|nr:2'-5' RNA ligase family protein [Chloroflexota bacterium]